jgi:hypothetical protein
MYANCNQNGEMWLINPAFAIIGEILVKIPTRIQGRKSGTDFVLYLELDYFANTFL